MDKQDLNKLTNKLREMDRKLNDLKELIERDAVPDRQITVDEAATLFAVSPATIRQRIQQGILKARKDGRAYRLSYADVLRQIGVKKNS
jgi:excisionase family DNA binding protein